MYKLGSHDTMTYLRPSNPWLRPFHFMAKTQKYDYKKQYELGARMFDIRLKYNTKTKTWDFAHGLIRFEIDNIEEVFEFFNSRPEPIYVRMVLEYNHRPKHIDEICAEYARYCDELWNKYRNIIFFGFNRKYDWKELYAYEGMPYPSIYQATSSMTTGILDDWWPWLYARVHNKDNVAQGTHLEWLFLDYIGCYYP